MAITIDGTNGISGVDGSNSTPAIKGADSDTGLSFGSDTASLSTAGVQRISVNSTGSVDITGSVSLSNTNLTSDGKLGIKTTPTSDLDVNGNYTSNIVAVGSNVFGIDCSQGNYFTQTTTSSGTFSFNNVPTSRAYSFVIEITHTGGTIAWPSSVKFPAATAPTLTTGKTHLFVFITDDGGACFRGAAVIDYDY